MKQLVIISGKGGTGKTIITASLSALAENKVMADCDVDAADLHLLLHPEIKERHDFSSGKTAIIDKKFCDRCGKCIAVCRFEAITDGFKINPISCEGCGVCFHVCPKKAIRMEDNLSGEWFVSETKYGPMVHAKLGIAEENSGKLVTLVRQKAKVIAEEGNYDWVIIDGAPGIGCPVIASIAGADLILVVTEPTLSGIHDMERVVKLARHFNIKTAVSINKFDINLDMSQRIEDYCQANDIPLFGKIPFDTRVVEALVNGKSIVEYARNREVSSRIKGVWEKVQKELS